MRTLLPLLCLPLFSSCLLSDVRSHTSIDADRVAAIEPGRTTAQEVLELLGAPNEVVQLGRRSAYRYDHSVEKQAALFLVLVALRGVDTQEDRVWVFVDEGGVVTHMGSTLQADEAEFSVRVGK